MADHEHLALIRRGVTAWNDWRSRNPGAAADLQEADLGKSDLRGANFRQTNLERANLTAVNLSHASLVQANLNGANLTHANLSGADLTSAFLTDAMLRGALLNDADLSLCQLTRANLSEAAIHDCTVYGISAWDVELSGAIQSNLIITPPSTAAQITVDSVELAQFTYLLLNSRKLRDVVDTVTSKAVLVLGRFTPQRKLVLNALRDALRSRGYIPILLDFEKPESRDLTETISILAHLSRFIVADLTEAKSIPQELASIVPYLPSVPVLPIVQQTYEIGMFVDYVARYPWVLGIATYRDVNDVPKLLESAISAAEAKLHELSAAGGR